MLDEVLEKLQEARKVVGNVPIVMDIRTDVNRINAEKLDVYKCTDIIADEKDVRLYNY